MTISTLEIDDESLKIESVSFDAYYFHFHLKDGRILSAPIWWYPRLFKASVKQRNAWAILPFGDGIEWDEIDEHISARGILMGKSAPGAVAPAMDAAE
ncbi:DUF2442 domain-containing protein [Fretibacter rubidus]|uniref:DUF2442 domain-containing protein n=1 Tax=Fretibacter rubidus TaxID=570162 RepID=UPI00352A2476